MALHPRVLFAGMNGRFSFAVLDSLLASGVEVIAVALPARGRPFEASRAEHPAGTARAPHALASTASAAEAGDAAHAGEARRVRQLSAAQRAGEAAGEPRSDGAERAAEAAIASPPSRDKGTVTAWDAAARQHARDVSASRLISPGLPIVGQPDLRQLAWQHGLPVYEGLPDVQAAALAVACWPKLIPLAYYQRFELALNVHPSLLPANRGPAPLFWTFRLGCRTTGVTVHQLAEQADAGPILVQQAVAVLDGVDGAIFEQELARLGGKLLATALLERPSPQPQDESGASYHPAPAPDDWVVPLSWPARRAFNFIRGVAHLGGPLEVAGQRIVEAVSCGDEALLPVATRECDGLLDVRMAPGVLTVRLAG